MELFRLIGSLAVEGAEEAKHDIDSVADEGEKTHSKLKSVFGKIGSAAVACGKTIATGLAVGTAAMGTLTYKALNVVGELEQNMGGSEAVFGKYANKMQTTAKNAFENMGLSTSSFLATANKMGALFQGVGIDIEESSDLAATSMQRAADVASIMGIDLNSAMESIAGAAKGNFTMMDNLGVAMNDTTLETYALEKGIKKTYSTMTTGEKVNLAMQMFLEKTAYATGNYAKENETLAGSFSTVKAAMTNFLDGSGDVDQLVDSFANAANVIIENLNNLLPRLVNGIDELIKKLSPKIPGLLKAVLPSIVQGAVSLMKGLAKAVPELIEALLPVVLEGAATLIKAVVETLPEIVTSIGKALKTAFETLLKSFGMTEEGIEKVENALESLGKAVIAATYLFGAFKAAMAIQSVVRGFQKAQVAISLLSMEVGKANLAQAALNGAMSLGETIVALLTGKMTLATLAQAAMTKAQAVLNAVMTANPIGIVVMAIAALVAAIGILVYKLANEEKAIKSVEDAQLALNEAKEAAKEAENSYIDAVDQSSEALKKLEEAEKNTGLSGEELFEKVRNGTLDYKDMTDAQREVYKAYLDNEEAIKSLKEATDALAEAKRNELIASYENDLALAAESGSYDEFKKSVIAAFEEGKLSAEDARDLIGKSMSEMSNSSQKTFMEDIPSDIREGLDPANYQTTFQKIKGTLGEQAEEYAKVREKVWSSVTEWASGAWEKIQSTFSDITGFFKEKFTTGWENVKAGFNSFKEWFNQHVIQPITEFYDKRSAPVVNKIIEIFQKVGEIVGAIFTYLRGMLKEHVIEPISNFFEELWNKIVSVWDRASSWFNEHVIQPVANFFSDLWRNISAQASGSWNKIKSVFSGVGDWFKKVWQKAYDAVTSVFSKIGTFFTDFWDKIKNTFSSLGTTISDAIGGAVKSGINGIISMIEGVINKAIGLINGAINLVNKIPGVNIGEISELSMPRLAKGGIVTRSTIANIGEDGAEAVVPLEKNTEWIDKLASKINGSTENSNLLDRIVELLEGLKEMKIYLQNDVLVGELAPAMDSRLGDISRSRDRGN